MKRKKDLPFQKNIPTQPEQIADWSGIINSNLKVAYDFSGY
jgi:hypothetical protein